jgi:hypothetical protein
MMRGFLLSALLLFGSLPATTNYQLNSYGFGSGGTANSSTTTYSLEGVSGELNGAPGSTANNTSKPGFVQTEQANVPQITLDNGSGQYYNKLHFVIDNQNNPTDATFLIAVTTTSTTNMNTATGLSYVQPDGTLSATLSTSDYQTYSAWGSSSGSLVIGLTPSTTYYVAVRATRGKFSESAYGPVVSQATAAPSLTFGLVTSSQSTPPFSVSLGALSAGGINSSAQTIDTSLTTNAASGGDIYVGGKNGGLLSSSTGYKINAVSSDLGSVNEGFGVQSSSVGQTSGGPLSVVSPYNGTGNVVGIVGSSLRSLFTATAPVTGGAGDVIVKAKSASTDIAATDYQEVLTFVAAGNF